MFSPGTENKYIKYFIIYQNVYCTYEYVLFFSKNVGKINHF